MNAKILDKQFITSTYGRFDVEIKSGKGSLLFDENGKEYIDLCSGVAVNSFGICDDIWINAVTEQISKVQHVSNYFYNEKPSILASKLCERTGLKKVFFSNSGAEANETAIKVARKYSFDKYGEGRSTIITLKNSFHGRTMAALTATGQPAYHKYFGPFLPGFDYIEPNNIDELKTALSRKDVCAIMIELVQGEGGVRNMTPEFVHTLYDLCNKNDILFICDEIQTGMGRCGAFFAYMLFDGVLPDIVTSAKALGGGLPIGATIIGEKAENTLQYGTHGSTFGGNPIACAGAITIVDRLNDEIFEEVKRKFNYVKSELEGSRGVKSVCGAGMMIGIEVEGSSQEIAKECVARGVLVITAKEKVRLLPALNIPMDLLKKAVAVLKEVIAEQSK